jgi:hypothetical protein
LVAQSRNSSSGSTNNKVSSDSGSGINWQDIREIAGIMQELRKVRSSGVIDDGTVIRVKR